MTMISRLKEPEELDQILPLIIEFHANNLFYSYYSLSSFIAFITNNCISPFFSIWIAKENDAIVGYAIATIDIKYQVKECIIYDAYSKSTDTDIVKLCFEEIEDWAKDSGCKYISCYSDRAEALEKKYGFEKVSTFMIKKL